LRAPEVAAGVLPEPIEPSPKNTLNEQATLRHHPEELPAPAQSSACTPRCWHLAKLHNFTPLHQETVMTIQFSKHPIAALSDGLPKKGSGLVCRLVCGRDDPGRERIRMWLIDLDDAQLRSGLGLTVEDIAILRTGARTASPLS
jgi:hypothetical protein